jgi:hypothetical protein
MCKSFCFLSWGEEAEHEANHSHPTNAKVKNVWSYTFTPPICLDDVVLG